jgi:hypothetical protein
VVAVADTDMTGPVSDGADGETVGLVTSTQPRLTDLSVSSITLQVLPLQAAPQDGAKPDGPPDAVDV